MSVDSIREWCCGLGAGVEPSSRLGGKGGSVSEMTARRFSPCSRRVLAPSINACGRWTGRSGGPSLGQTGS